MGIQERLKRILSSPVAGTLSGPRGVNLDPITVRDAMGKVLELGDEVLAVQPSMNLRVAGIQRVVAPGAPPDLVQVTLVARVLVAVPNNSLIESLYALRHAAEIKDGFLQNIGAEKAEPLKPPTPEDLEPRASDPPPGDRPAIHLTDRRD